MGARKPSGAAAAASSSSTPRTSERNVELFGEIPEGRRRKFILVEDPHRGGMRVRVRVTLDQVEMKEIPDSYRKGNSVFPRSYFPMQMQSPRPHRFPEDEDGDDDLDGDGGADGRGRDNHVKPGRGRTLVPVPTLDGTEAEVPTPRMTRTKRKKEAALNDLGYRMSWSQSRVFAGRTIFLQRARKFVSSNRSPVVDHHIGGALSPLSLYTRCTITCEALSLSLSTRCIIICEALSISPVHQLSSLLYLLKANNLCIIGFPIKSSISHYIHLSVYLRHVKYSTDTLWAVVSMPGIKHIVDAYRNKMRSTMMATGQDASQIAPHFETRVGKRRWKERARRSGRQSTP